MKTKFVYISLLTFCLILAGCQLRFHSLNNTESNVAIVLDSARNDEIQTKSTASSAVIDAETINKEIDFNPIISSEKLDGKIVYSKFISREPVDIQIFTMDLEDGIEKQITWDGMFSNPLWSPDGKRILYITTTEETLADIFIMDEDGTNNIPIVSTTGMDLNPSWSPDGKMISYTSNISGRYEVYLLNLLTKEVNKLTDDALIYHSGSSWSPDGSKIVFVGDDDYSAGTKLYIVDIVTGITTEIDQENHFQDGNPIWSPDGNYIIFPRSTEEYEKLILFDIKNQKENILTGNFFSDDVFEFNVEKSPYGNFISFSADGYFYIMDMSKMIIYPLDVYADNLSYYPK